MPSVRDRSALLLAFGGALAVLAAVGSVLAPSWQRARLAPAQGYGVLPEAPEAGVAPRSPTNPNGPGPAGQDPAGPLRRVEVSVPVVDTTLHGTLVTPGPGRHPAVVLVHGGGPATRAGLMDLAERFALGGVAALVYDKRRTGYSFTHRDYAQLGDDALALVRMLRERPDVDRARVGLWGISEGGWVVPLAAGRAPDEVAFAVLVAAPTVSPGVQVSWAVDDGLRRQGAPDGARRFTSRTLAIGGADYVNHDPLPALRRLRQPVLALYGTDDRAVPSEQSARILADQLDRAGNGAYTIRFFGGADHGMRVDGDYAPGYLPTMISWIRGLPDSAGVAPRVAGAAPAQVAAATGPPVPWYASGRAVAAAHVLIGAGYLTMTLAARVRRRRARSGAAGPGDDPTWCTLWPRLRRMSIGGAGTMVVLNGAVGALVALGFAGAAGPASQLAWLVLRASAVTTVGLTAAAAVSLSSALRGGWRPDGPAGLATGGAFAATGLVLLLGADWELFAPSW